MSNGLVITPEIGDKYVYDAQNKVFVTKDKMFETEIGDAKNASDFFPQVKIKRWDNECNFSLRLLDGVATKPSVSCSGKEIVWSRGDIDVRFYLLDSGRTQYIYDSVNDTTLEDRQLENGGYEFEIRLNKKPLTNQIQFSIQTKGLDFYKQVEPDDDRVHRIVGNCAYDKDDKRVEYWADNVIGSYAVYHSSMEGNYQKVGGQNYRAGKAFHIYRPKIIDADGKEAWGELAVDTQTGILTVTIPQAFLNSAKYPIRHAAGFTFGYETIGSFTRDWGDYMYTSLYANGSDSGTGDSMTFYLAYISSGTKKGVLGVWNTGLGLIGQTNEGSYGTADDTQWQILEFSSAPEIAASTSYWMGGYGESTDWDVKRDTGASNSCRYYSRTYNSALPNPLAGSLWTYKFSLYCTYSEEAGGTVHDLTGTADSVTSIISTVSKMMGLTGTTASASSASANSKILKALLGTIDSVSTVDGLIDLIISLAGTTDSVSTSSADLNYITKLFGTADSTSTVDGALKKLMGLTGTTDSVSTTSADLRNLLSLIGTIGPVSTVDAQLKLLATLLGTIGSASTASADMGQAKSITGTTDSLSTTSADINKVLSLIGTIGSQSSVSAQMRLLLALVGSIDGISSVTGELSIGGIVELIGTIAALSTVSGDVAAMKVLTGTADELSSITAELSRLRQITGTTDAQSTVSAILSVLKAMIELDGTISVLSAVSGTLQKVAGLEGSVDSASAVSAVASLLLALTGTVDAQSAVSAVLAEIGLTRLGMDEVYYICQNENINAFIKKTLETLVYIKQREICGD